MIESPFLPGTNIQYAWDATSLELFKSCPRLYYYTMICGWQGRGDSVHLRFGIEYHEALQNYDKSLAAGIRHDDALHDVVRALLVATGDWWSDEELGDMRGSASKKTRASLVRTVIWHLEKFKDDPAKTFIKEDGSAAVEQSFRWELDWGPQSTFQTVIGGRVSQEVGPYDGTDTYEFKQHYILCGHLDRIVSFANELYVMDYKTTSYAPTSWFFDKFDPHNQMSMYSLAAKVVLNAPIKGVIISGAKINEETTDFGRGITSRSDAQIQEWIDDLHYWFTLAEQCALADRWPQNDTSCDRYGGCKFRGVCSKSPQVRERFLEADFVKLPKEERWNPLKSR